jgi:hypothetical protein
MPGAAEPDEARAEDFDAPVHFDDDVELPTNGHLGTSPVTPGREPQGLDEGVDMHADPASPDMCALNLKRFW